MPRGSVDPFVMKQTGSHANDRTARTTHRSHGTEESRTTAGFAVFVGLSVAVAGGALGSAAVAAAGVAVVAGTAAVAHLTARDRPVDPPDPVPSDPVAVATTAE